MIWRDWDDLVVVSGSHILLFLHLKIILPAEHQMSSEHDVACESVLFWPQRSTPVGIRQVALVLGMERLMGHGAHYSVYVAVARRHLV